MSRINKHNNMDKWEAHIPTKRDFFHDDYQVSAYQDLFHAPSAWASRTRHGRGFTMGVQKKTAHVSGTGINICSYGVGQSDQ